MLQQLNLHEILRARITGTKGKLIPGFLISGLENLIHQDELNEVLVAVYPSEGTEFARRVYDYFNIKLEVEGLENVPRDRRLIFACNHPLGGLDGIGMIAVLGEVFGDENVKVLVNDMLMNIHPLRPVFLPINKYGGQAREAAKKIAETYAGDGQMVIFPAGLVSRIGKNGCIMDLKWQKSFVDKAIKYQRDIVPVRFDGLNRSGFYKFAKWRKKLGVKVNLEQALLPAEFCNAKGKTFRITFGEPISWEKLRDSKEDHETIAAKIRHIVHNPDTAQPIIDSFKD